MSGNLKNPKPFRLKNTNCLKHHHNVSSTKPF